MEGKYEPFVPSESDKAWLYALLRVVKHGGTWVTSFAHYKVDKDAHTLTIVGTPPPNPDWPPVLNRERVAAVANAIGWRVK